MIRAILSVVAYVVATFVTQAISHFSVNAKHYASIPYLRAEPIFPLGVASMLVQGAILAYLYSQLPRRRDAIWRSLTFAWLAGGFLVSYLALAEAAKYSVPAIGEWIGVEVCAGAAQFTLYGVLLWVVYRTRQSESVRDDSPRTLDP